MCKDNNNKIKEEARWGRPRRRHPRKHTVECTDTINSSKEEQRVRWWRQQRPHPRNHKELCMHNNNNKVNKEAHW